MSASLSRREFIGAAATGIVGVGGAWPNALDVRDFNAVGDGKTDDTAAIQKALNKAAETKATVFIPAGVFACSTLKMPPNAGLCGNPTWDYSNNAGSVLRLCDASARCLIDITGALGFHIDGLCLDGGEIGNGIHGIMLDKPDFGTLGDTICIERCRIGHFSGDGLHLSRIWVFSIRHSMICYNKLNGLCYQGWDGFVVDNWFSGNGEAGIAACDHNASGTFTGNRIEWNNRHGIILKGGDHYNITGNYFDRNSGPAIALLPRGKRPCKSVTVTGNVIYRSGAPHGGAFSDKYQSAHLRFEEVEGLTCIGNTCDVGRDDGGGSETTPDYSMVLRALTHSVIANNVMHEGAVKELVANLGGHGPGLVLKDNPGSIYKTPV